jgi:LPS-assembly lipoprotein
MRKMMAPRHGDRPSFARLVVGLVLSVGRSGTTLTSRCRADADLQPSFPRKRESMSSGLRFDADIDLQPSFPRKREFMSLGPRFDADIDLQPSFPRKRESMSLGPGFGGNDQPATTLGPRFRGDAESALQSRFLRMLGVALLGGLGACGFHLRGQADYAFSTMFVSSPTALPITTELKRSLEGIGSAQLVAAADKAQVVLDVNSVEDNKQILSLSAGGKVREFLLTKRVLFRVHDNDGKDWLPTAEVLIRRSYTYSDTEALAKEAQEQRLWREMQTDAVQQIVRRLQSARKPVA